VSLTPDGNGLIEFLAIGGTADNVTTDAIGYAAGATIINLAAGATGYINQGQSIKFATDPNYYRVSIGIADVSLGGAITLTDPLVQSIPAIATDVWTGNEVKRGTQHRGWQIPSGYLAGVASPVGRDWYVAGEVGQLWLDSGYGIFDHNHVDVRTESVAMSGATQVRRFQEFEEWIFTQDFISDDRGAGIVSDMEAIELFIDMAVKGDHDFIFFPDFTHYPNEFIHVQMLKRDDAKRVQKTKWFNQRFHFRVAKQLTIPPTPAFV